MKLLESSSGALALALSRVQRLHLEFLPNNPCWFAELSLMLLTKFPRFTDGSDTVLEITGPLNTRINLAVAQRITAHELRLQVSFWFIPLSAMPCLRRLVLGVSDLDELKALAHELPRMPALRTLELDESFLETFSDIVDHVAFVSSGLHELHVRLSTGAPELDLSQCTQLRRVFLRGVNVLLHGRRTTFHSFRKSVLWLRRLWEDDVDVVVELKQNREGLKEFLLDLELGMSTPKGDGFVFALLDMLAPLLRTADVLCAKDLGESTKIETWLSWFNVGQIRKINDETIWPASMSVTNITRSLSGLNSLSFISQDALPHDLLPALLQADAEGRPLGVLARIHGSGENDSPQALAQARFLQAQLSEARQRGMCRNVCFTWRMLYS